jgi:hypothetical protein
MRSAMRSSTYAASREVHESVHSPMERGFHHFGYSDNLDGALGEIRRDESSIDTVERAHLKAPGKRRAEANGNGGHRAVA